MGHTARLGEKCYQHVMWAKSEGIVQQPHWYPGLNVSSTFEDFQSFLRDEVMEDCPRPCAPTTSTTTTISTTSTYTSTTSSITTSTTSVTRTTSTTTATTTTTLFIVL